MKADAANKGTFGHQYTTIMSKRSVQFSSSILRSPRRLSSDEVFVINTFNRHIHNCRACAISESSHEYRCRLCPRGHDYGRDVMDYVRYDSGRFVSEHDAKSGLGRTELVVPEDCGAARVFLQIRDAQLRHKQAEPRTPKHTRPRLSTGLPSYSSKPVLVEPILSGQHQGHRAGASFIYVTIPSFTIPVRLSELAQHHS